ncbi:MAG: SMP-30/gluconolactonase/LRE family protein [Pseudomonadota bacterium]|nr:SMP-30/gluconolactonase/LRE family protein [Pseudomonadota bacterium]
MLLSLMLLACTGSPDDTAAASCDPASGTICTWAGTGIAGLGGEGTQATETNLYWPIDLTWGPDANAYVIDWNNHRIRQVTPEGVVTTISGTGELGDGPVGPAVEARFNHPANIAFDSQGRMVIAAWHNSRIMRVDLTTGMLEFIAGDGSRSFAGDGGDPTVAKLDLPSSVVLDARDQIYIADQANQRIRCIDADNVIDTIAGNGTPGYAGDGGPATEAEVHASVGQAAAPANRMALSPDGTRLYFADTGNHRIRYVDLAAGTMNAYAGNGTAAYAGDGGQAADASFYGPTDLAFGPDGELYVADTSNSCVRRIDPDGVVSTFAGVCGQMGYEGDAGAPADALLNQPYGVALDADANVYIADTYNQVVRVVYR